MLGNKLSDFAVSSYSPSLISLLNGHKSEKGTGKTNQMLAVALPEESRLPGAGIEIEKLKVHIKHFPLLELLESKATIEAVTTGLKNLVGFTLLAMEFKTFQTLLGVHYFLQNTPN